MELEIEGYYKHLDLFSSAGGRFSFLNINYSNPDSYQFDERDELLYQDRGKFEPSIKYQLPHKGEVKKWDAWVSSGMLYIDGYFESQENQRVANINKTKQQIIDEAMMLLGKIDEMVPGALLGNIRIQALIDNPGKNIKNWRITVDKSPKEFILTMIKSYLRKIKEQVDAAEEEIHTIDEHKFNTIKEAETKKIKKRLVSFFNKYFFQNTWRRDELILELINQLDWDFFIASLLVEAPDCSLDELCEIERNRIWELITEWKQFLKNQLIDLGQPNPWHLTQLIIDNDKAVKISGNLWDGNKWLGTRALFISFVVKLFENLLLHDNIRSKRVLRKVCNAHNFTNVTPQNLSLYSTVIKDSELKEMLKNRRKTRM
jgi:hypothetical protein